VIEDSHRFAFGWVRQRRAGRALGALVSRLVSAAAAGSFDNGQCLPALSDLMPSGFARLPWWRRRQRGGIEQNVPKRGNIEKVVPLSPIHIMR
jgi:hypothetical protein